MISLDNLVALLVCAVAIGAAVLLHYGERRKWWGRGLASLPPRSPRTPEPSSEGILRRAAHPAAPVPLDPAARPAMRIVREEES